MDILKYIEQKGRKGFNWWVLHETRDAQKKYGFDMTQKDGAYSNTHNNEADAFKHAYMSWFLSYWGNDIKSKQLCDMHEDETPNAPDYERNMDLWNNAIGREIAYEIKWNLGDDYDLFGEEWANQIAKRKIWEMMQKGELITNPITDRRKFKKDKICLNKKKLIFQKEKMKLMKNILNFTIKPFQYLN